MGKRRTIPVYHGSIAIRTDARGKAELYISFSNVGEQRLCQKTVQEIQGVLTRNFFEFREQPVEENDGKHSFILCEVDDPVLVEEQILDVHALLDDIGVPLEHGIFRPKEKPGRGVHYTH